MKFRIGCVMVGLLSLLLPMAAQTAGSNPASAQVPLLVNFSGVFTDVNGKPLTGVVGVTFSLYQEQQGGSPLWLETQNVQAGKIGNYTVALGSTSSQGLPANVFANGEARWLGVQVQGQAEQPRVSLMSVPYALKALDAQTLGGRPASAFLAAAGVPGAAASVTGSGTKDFIPRWTSASQIGNSNIFENASGEVGIATSTPAAKLDVNGTTDIRNTLTLFPNGSPALKVSGSTFTINSAGKVTFVAGQTFPGTGTITGVKASSGLTGGGTSGTVTLGLIDTCSSGQVLQWNGTKWVCSNAGTGTITGVTAQAPITGGGSGGNVKVGLTDSCSSGQVLQWSGTAWACSTVGGGGTITGVTAGTDMTGGGTSGNVTLNLDTTKVPILAANNTFTGFQQLFNNTVIVGPITGATEGQLAAGSPSVDNPAFGAAGFNAAFGSGGSGGDAIVSFGGSGDIETNNGNTGAAGIYAEGGAGSAGGAGIFAVGGGAGEGGCCADGPGGYFEGGSNNFSGDGIEALTGGGLAGNFLGSVNISSDLNVSGSKNFKIDHPLDPANKYLVHSAVESSERMNIYTGNVITDGRGEATVHLPDWFEVLNTDFRYQLTVIGQFAQAIVAREIQNGAFDIRTSVPKVKVSWQITAVRQDAYAKAHPLVVEEQKDARLRGFYIHPELYGAPAEKQIEWARHPELMRQARDRKPPSRTAVKGAILTNRVPSSR
jgi:hypothetical protein